MDSVGVGIVVLLFNEEGDLLIGKRKGSHGAGTWSLPGGKLEFMEDAMRRISIETEEETGLVLAPARFTQREWGDNVWTDKDKGQQHWITLFTEAELGPGDNPKEPRVTEPDKCEEWRWVDPFTLRGGRYELFHPLEQYLVRFPVGGWPRYNKVNTRSNRCY
jgi:8-oxo-dGTP diphosphatase